VRPEGTLSAVLMRGGTSKGVFVREADLPCAGPERDAFLLALMGSPDPMQIDGLGGTHSSTSKVVAVTSSPRPDADVEYLFAQVGIDTPRVDYSTNCGNLTAAVGPYAIEEGLVAPVEPVTGVRLFNRNTGRRIVAHVPVIGGRPATVGTAVIAGVPGSGAGIVTEYLDPGGAVTDKLLPTGRSCDAATFGDAAAEVSLVDVSACVAFVRADELGVADDIAPTEGNADASLLARLEDLRGSCAVLLGRSSDAGHAGLESPAVPRLALVAPPRAHALPDGTVLKADTHDLVVRALSMGRFHHACPLTTLLCVAGSAFIPGTIPHAVAPLDGPTCVRIAHPKGVVEVSVALRGEGSVHDARRIASVSVVRTARRLMEGRVYVRASAD
jgi:2-methylaconitate isomerase